jgi:hypothetical protein
VAGDVTVRLRDCEPPSLKSSWHDSVHVDHALNDDTTQCVGHSNSLQERKLRRLGHSTPPEAGSLAVRERSCVPTPHDTLHVVHVPQSSTTQSSGQLASLQPRVSSRYGHT